MGFGPPPDDYDGCPVRRVLASGTSLWRVHDRDYGPTAFKDEPADKHFGGGRFDSTADDLYPYLYAALADTTAVTETLVRGLPFAGNRTRTLPRKSLSGRSLCRLELTSELTLISLVSSTDLAAVKQDDWLISADAKEYAFTRRWAHWLRAQACWAHGLIWSTRRDLGEASVVLFGDRCPAGAVRLTEPCLDLDRAAGARWLNSMLAPYDVCIRPPSHHR
jgi:RES domain